MAYLFSRKIKCGYCSKNHRGKTEKNKKVYICSTYSNRGKDYCKRNQIDEDELIYIIVKHLKIQKIDINKIEKYVDIIEIEEGSIKIKYVDDTESILNGSRVIY